MQTSGEGRRVVGVLEVSNSWNSRTAEKNINHLTDKQVGSKFLRQHTEYNRPRAVTRTAEKVRRGEV